MLGGVGVAEPAAAARAILEEYGSIAAFARADEDQLRRLLGGGEAARSFVFARELIEAGLHESVLRSPIDPAEPALRRYLLQRLAHRREEVLLALFGDAARGFIGETVLATGQSDSVAVSARRLVESAIRCDARTFLLVHNHPSGDPRPSRRDLRETEAIEQVTAPLDLRLIDHLVIGGTEMHSIRQGGRI